MIYLILGVVKGNHKLNDIMIINKRSFFQVNIITVHFTHLWTSFVQVKGFFGLKHQVQKQSTNFLFLKSRSKANWKIHMI